MRRMLDPTKVGGGRHCYRIQPASSFYYLIYTAKDYDLEVGIETKIENFYNNEDYKDLRAFGSYPAGGYYINNGSQIIATKIKLVSSDPLFIHLEGLNAQITAPANIEISWITPYVSVIKLS